VWEVDASHAVAADGCVACGDRLLLCASGEIEEPGVAGFETARADTAEDERALTARVGDAGGKVQFVGLITGVCSVYMWLLRSSDQEVAQGAVALDAVIGIRTERSFSRATSPGG